MDRRQPGDAQGILDGQAGATDELLAPTGRETRGAGRAPIVRAPPERQASGGKRPGYRAGAARGAGVQALTAVFARACERLVQAVLYVESSARADSGIAAGRD